MKIFPPLTGIAFVLLANPASAADLSLDAPPNSLRLAAGETARLQVQATTTTSFRIVLRDLAFEPASASGVALSIRRADRRSVEADWAHCTAAMTLAGCGADVAAEAGARYLVEATAPFSASARFTLAAVGMRAWPAAGAASAAVALREAQRYTLESGGESITLGLVELAHEPPGGRLPTWFALLNADGSQRMGQACNPAYGSCKLAVGTLPVGRYTVLVRPPPGVLAKARPLRTRDTVLRAADNAIDVRVDVPGAVARLDIPAAAGEAINVSLDAIRLEGPGPVYLRLISPGGGPATMRMIPSKDSAGTLGPFKVRQSGTYTLLVDPGFSKLAATLQVKR